MNNKQKVALRRQYTSQFYHKNHAAFVLAVITVFLNAVVNLVLAWLIQQIIDAVSGSSAALGIGMLTWLTICVIILILVMEAITYVSRPRFIMRAMQQYKAFAFSKLMHKSIASFNNEPTARYISAFSNDATVIEANYLDNIFEFILNVVLFAGALSMMLIYSPVLTLIACAFFIPPIIVSFVAGRRMEAAERNISEKNESFTAMLKDSLGGFPVIKSFRAEKAIMSQFNLANHAAEQTKCDKRKLTTVISALSEITGVGAQLGTFLAGGWLILSGWNISVGVLISFISLTANVICPIRELPAMFAKRKAAIGLIDKLAEEMEDNIRDEGEAFPKYLENGIELRNVSFGYEDDKEILHNISLKFEADKSYAIVGASGSGKSTLLNMLMAGNSDYKGEVYYDVNELRNIHSDALYDIVSIIQQNVFVFDASVRDNITMFGSFPKDEVDTAIAQSGLDALIAAHGEDYACGENGNGLSGGEKQRISIARSLLKKSPVLLVDEATAALDAQTAYHVTDSILNLDGLLRIVITHALDKTLLARYDGIIVLKDGSVIETGTFDELISKKGYFYSLYTVSQ